VVGGAAGKKMCEKEAKKNISERKVKNKKLVLNLFQDHNPMKKLVLTLKQVQGFQEISDSKEVKQGGNNETKKGFYPY